MRVDRVDAFELLADREQCRVDAVVARELCDRLTQHVERRALVIELVREQLRSP